MSDASKASVGSGASTDSALLDEIETLLARRTKPEQKDAGPAGDHSLPREWEEQIDYQLFTEKQIQAKVKEMAAKISKDYAGEEVLCVALLNGAFVFAADLTRQLSVKYQMDFISASSYHGTKSSGSIQLHRDIIIDPKDKHILILEDLSDTGRTVMWIRQHLASKGPKSVKIAVLLDKVERRSVDGVVLDYVGWECPDEFVVGYGMDYNENFRCLPFVGVLKPKAFGG